MTPEEAREKFGQRVQRCSGCFVAFHVKDLWIDEEGNYFCDNCHTEGHIHFNQYSEDVDFTQFFS